MRLAETIARPASPQTTEGVCVGQWHKRACNHWVSIDGMKAYLIDMAEQSFHTFPCPVCLAERCPRCANHSRLANGAAACCLVPARQLRDVLSSDEMAKCVPWPWQAACRARGGVPGRW